MKSEEVEPFLLLHYEDEFDKEDVWFLGTSASKATQSMEKETRSWS